MDNKKEFHKRKTIRYKDYNYNNEGVYFLTICTKDHKCILSKIKSNIGEDGPSILDDCNCVYTELTQYGKIADKYIRQLSEFYDNINIEKYVIMPNHIHIMLSILESSTLEEKKQNSVISNFVSTFKRFCNREYGENIWQARSYDHIIRNHKDYEQHLTYILENPVRWRFDDLYCM